MTDQPEALRLAQTLEQIAPSYLEDDELEIAACLLREQHAEIERLRRDAERYRWLRDKAPPDIGDIASVRDSHDPSEIDAAIDAAMGEK